jgi:NAD(P)-dependent dehydrogenase (short-subunit alcohol dehydrogenase family)
MVAVADRFARRLVWFRQNVEGRLRGETPTDLPDDLATPDPREQRLCNLLHLDTTQLRFLWACACVVADPLLHAPLVALGGADARRGLALSTYAAVFDDAQVGALVSWLATQPLSLRLGILVRGADDLLPGSTPYVVATRLVSYLQGSDAHDPAIIRAGGVISLPERYQVDHIHRELVEKLASLGTQQPPPLVVIAGPRGIGRRTMVAAAFARDGRRVVAIDGARALPNEELVHALHREALLLGAVPVIANANQLVESAPGELRKLARAVEDAPGICVVTTNDADFDLPVARPTIRFHLRPLEASTRALIWRNALADDNVDEAISTELAMRYQLGPGAIRSAVETARRLAPELGREELVAGVRSTIVERFGRLADRIEVTERWEDCVLPAETFDQISALVSRVRHAYRVYEEWRFPRTTARGGGVAALFSGPPGTGKTLVAGIIARELDRDLFRVDLSRVVSKWVGETEKQLSELFDAAEASDALLLFDEADSLFAKRTEVKSSSDRYANLEVNYLLQRIETFGGITILTTNLDTSIDAALRRRLAAHIVFWPPEYDERVQLWRRYATNGAPTTGTLDLDTLAEEFPDMTGANIRNASLAAAFLAAADNSAISQELLVRAARSEYRAMGRVLGRK